MSLTWREGELVVPVGSALAKDMVLETYGNLVSGSMCYSPLYSHSGPQTTFPVSVVGCQGASVVVNDVILRFEG